MSLLVHPENQKLLWDIINNNPFVIQFFKNNTHFNKEQWFRVTMEHFYNIYKGKQIEKPELNQLNKEILTYMIQNLHTVLSQQTVPKSEPVIPPVPVQNSYSNIISTPPIPENNREELYKQQFLQKQQEYKSMFDKTPPAALDFSEKEKDVAISNMDELLQKQLLERNTYLNVHPPPIQPVQLTNMQENIQLVPDETPNKKNDEVSTKQVLELLQEQKSEISLLKTMILELSKRLPMTNEGVYPTLIRQEPSSPNPINNINNNVLVETVESDGD